MSFADASSGLPLDLSGLQIPNFTAVGTAGVPSAQSTAAQAEVPNKRINPNFNQAIVKDYVVFEGTVLETALVTPTERRVRRSDHLHANQLCVCTRSMCMHTMVSVCSSPPARRSWGDQESRRLRADSPGCGFPSAHYAGWLFGRSRSVSGLEPDCRDWTERLSS